MRRLTLLCAAAAMALGGCKRDPDPELAVRFRWVEQKAFAEDAGAAWKLTSNGEILFDDGWGPMETVPRVGVHGDAWRWMGRTSLMRLNGHDRDMRLTVVGWVPYDILHAAPAITYRFNGRRVDSYIPPPGHFTRTFLLPRSAQRAGWNDFTIDTTSTAQERGDPRDLGFAIADVRWEPAEP